MMTSLARAVAVDLGGTFIRCGLVEESGTVNTIFQCRIRSFLDDHASGAIWEGILSSIVSYVEENQHLVARNRPIVLSFPGQIEPNSIISSAPTIVGNAAVLPDIVALLSERSGRPVFALNDVSAATWYLSRRNDYTRFMTVTVSSGIGSKLFDRRHPDGVLDKPSYCGEIGHMVVDSSINAPLCDCGGRGHLGAIASGRGIERLARRMAASDLICFERSSCARTYGASADSLTNEAHLVPAARAGDDWALSVVRASIAPLADVLLSVTLAAGLEKVIVIGGFAQNLGKIYSHLLREAIALRSFPAPYRLPDNLVEQADFDEEVCLRGAAIAALAMEPSS